jgi:hypothetical protein
LSLPIARQRRQPAVRHRAFQFEKNINEDFETYPLTINAIHKSPFIIDKHRRLDNKI